MTASRRLDRTASLTAQVNAAQRAAESLRPPDRRLLNDPYSRNFVTHPVLQAILGRPWAADVALRIMDSLWGGLHAHIALRVRYADDICSTAINDGTQQLVLLGAGFDTVSLRRSIDPITVFEVDSPHTQTAKRRLVEQHMPTQARKIHWVPCDFEHDDLVETLVSEGFDPSRPSMVVWLGVSMYLSREAIYTTLAAIAALCAVGSHLVLDYITAGVAMGSTPWRSARRVARTVERRGEPYRSDFTAADIGALLMRHGFELEEHLGVSGLLGRYDPTGSSGLAGDDWLAVVHAQRRSPTQAAGPD